MHSISINRKVKVSAVLGLMASVFHLGYPRPHIALLYPSKERERLYKNKSMVVDKDDNSAGRGSKIFWSADDATAYSFTVKEEGGTERVYTVAEFFLNKYGIKLKYPKMPIVHLNSVSELLLYLQLATLVLTA